MSRIIRPWSNRIRPSSPGGRRGGGGAVTLTKSVDFDGLTQRAEGAFTLDLSSSKSIALWTKVTDASSAKGWFEFEAAKASNRLFDELLITKNTGGTRWTINYRAANVGYMTFTHLSGSVASLGWHLLIINATVTGANVQFSWSLDGSSFANVGGSYPAATGIDKLTVADIQGGGGGGNWDHRVGRMWVGSGALSNAQAAALYADPQSVPDSLVARWDMGDGDVLPTLSDSIASADLTAINSPSIETDYPVAP